MPHDAALRGQLEQLEQIEHHVQCVTYTVDLTVCTEEHTPGNVLKQGMCVAWTEWQGSKGAYTVLHGAHLATSRARLAAGAGTASASAVDISTGSTAQQLHCAHTCHGQHGQDKRCSGHGGYWRGRSSVRGRLRWLPWVLVSDRNDHFCCCPGGVSERSI